MVLPRRVIMIYSTPVVGIHCVHYIQQKDFTARFATALLGPQHRRRINTESKANCRRFGLGSKIECRSGNLLCESVVALCTQLLYFSLYFCWGVGMIYVDLYFKFKDRFNYFLYYFICQNVAKNLMENQLIYYKICNKQISPHIFDPARLLTICGWPFSPRKQRQQFALASL